MSLPGPFIPTYLVIGITIANTPICPLDLAFGLVVTQNNYKLAYCKTVPTWFSSSFIPICADHGLVCLA